MSNEFLKQRIADRRTKPQLTSINVNQETINTAGYNNLNMAFGAMAELAAKADNIKMSNERNSILIQQEQLEQAFKEKYKDPLIYQNEGKYGEMMQSYDALVKAKQKLVLDSKYLTGDDIQKFNLDITKRSGDALADMQYKRNVAYNKEVTDQSIWDIQQTAALWKTVTPGDAETEKRLNDLITGNIKSLRDNGFITDVAAEQLYMKTIIDVEQDIALRRIESEISNTMFENPEDKIKAIDNLAKGFANSESIKNRMSLYQKNSNGVLKGDSDYSGMLLEAYGDKIDGKLERESYKAQSWQDKINAQKDRETAKEEANREKQRLSQQKYIDDVNTALEDNDVYQFAKVVDDRKFTTEQLLDDDSLSKRYYNKSRVELSDMSDGAVGSYVHPKRIGNIKEHISSLKADGVEGSALANEAIYPVVNEMAGDDPVKRNLILKHIGVEIREFNPVVLSKGESNPRYFEVNKNMIHGRGAEIDSTMLSYNRYIDKSAGAGNRYDRLLNEMGDVKNPAFKSALDSYLYGAVKNSKDLMILEYMKTSPSLAVNEFLKKEENFKLIEQDIPKIKELMQAQRYKKADLNKGVLGVAPVQQQPVATTDNNEGDMYEF